MFSSFLFCTENYNGLEGDNDSSCLVICCRICTLSCYLLLYRHLLCQAWVVGAMVLRHPPLPWVGWAWVCLRCHHLECHRWGPTETNFEKVSEKRMEWTSLFSCYLVAVSLAPRFPCISWRGQWWSRRSSG